MNTARITDTSLRAQEASRHLMSPPGDAHNMHRFAEHCMNVARDTRRTEFSGRQATGEKGHEENEYSPQTLRHARRPAPSASRR